MTWHPCDGPHLPAELIGTGASPGENSMCSNCPPRPCADCGGMEHPDALCLCWTDLTAMPAADLKAEMAADGWNVSVTGRLTR